MTQNDNKPAAAPIDERMPRFIPTRQHGRELWQGGAKLAVAGSDAIASEIATALNARAPSPADERAATAWQTGAPPTKVRDYDEYIVAVRRKVAPDRVFVFASNYANNYGAEELVDEDGKEYIANGWYTVGHDSSGEFSSLFMPMLEDGDQILGWQPLPKWTGAKARAASANQWATGLGWRVREHRAPDGTLMDCFVEAPAEGDMPYALQVLGDDYTGYGDVARKHEHCKMIVAWANRTGASS